MAGSRVPVAAVVAVAGLAAAAAFVAGLRGGLTDLVVYQFGGRAVLHGLPLYELRDPVEGLRFTYPPFAAVVMVPLALLPASVAAALWTAASVGALAAVIALVRGPAARPSVALLTVGALALEPVWQNLSFGQVNILLMLAVLVDVLRPARRWSGVLVGVAAGIKLTPLVFVILLVLVARRSAALRAGLAFTGTVVVGFLVMPGQAVTYWTDHLVEGGRVGPPALAHNQSAYGALTRLLHHPPSTLLWLAVAGPLAVLVLLLATACWHRGDPLLGTCLGALAMLVLSPISWSHHWVWAVPVALALWDRARWIAAAWVTVFVTRPILWPPWGQGREYEWTVTDHLLGNAYLLTALATVLWAATTATSGARRVGGGGPDRGRDDAGRDLSPG